MPHDLVAEVEDALAFTGCTVVGLGPHSVAVMGDARFYGPCVIVRFAPWHTTVEVTHLSTKITNEVRGISRVLREVI